VPSLRDCCGRDPPGRRRRGRGGGPPAGWLRPGLATTELAAVDYPQPGGLTWPQLGELTSAALATPGCAGWSVCIYNPELDPGLAGADAIISYLSQAITAVDGR
jgi:arginase